MEPVMVRGLDFWMAQQARWLVVGLVSFGCWALLVCCLLRWWREGLGRPSGVGACHHWTGAILGIFIVCWFLACAQDCITDGGSNAFLDAFLHCVNLCHEVFTSV